MLVGRPEAATGQKTTAKAAATNATTAAERVERRLPRLVALRILFTAFSPFAPARSAQLPRCGSSAAALRRPVVKGRRVRPTHQSPFVLALSPPAFKDANARRSLI